MLLFVTIPGSSGTGILQILLAACRTREGPEHRQPLWLGSRQRLQRRVEAETPDPPQKRRRPGIMIAVRIKIQPRAATCRAFDLAEQRRVFRGEKGKLVQHFV